MQREIADVMDKMYEALSKESMTFAQVFDLFAGYSYRAILLAWGELRSKGVLARDDAGRYFCRSNPVPL